MWRVKLLVYHTLTELDITHLLSTAKANTVAVSLHTVTVGSCPVEDSHVRAFKAKEEWFPCAIEVITDLQWTRHHYSKQLWRCAMYVVCACPEACISCWDSVCVHCVLLGLSVDGQYWSIMTNHHWESAGIQLRPPCTQCCYMELVCCSSAVGPVA